eukprot:Gb_21337 [translate_table: standard]
MLHMHPLGSLLSWACLSIECKLAMCIPVDTTTMVNIWSIMHDSRIWESPEKFHPERFIVAEGGENVDEIIFQGTNTMTLLIGWAMVEMVLNLETQRKLHAKLDNIVGQDRSIQDEEITKLSYLQAVVKEMLHMHPPSLLLSWAYLSTEDV